MAKTYKNFNRFEASVRLTKDARYVAATNEQGTNQKLFFTGACNAGYQVNGKDAVDFIEFVINGKLADSMKDYLKKGTALEIRDARFNTWQTKDGDKYLTHYLFQVNALDFVRGGSSKTETQGEPVAEVIEEPVAEVEEVVGVDISDADLPF